ncbi:MAG: hypothetical protein J7K78_02670 [Thaumarchaeota archaeon]|nr:hypothetical protein [Nitrososphaerota archaeon]
MRRKIKRAGFVVKRRSQIKWGRSDWAALILILITITSIALIVFGEDEAAEKLFIFLAGGGFGQILNTLVNR